MGKNHCTESNNTTNNNIIESTNDNAALNNQLNFKEFSDIVGFETIEKCNNIGNVEIENHSKEFLSLFKLYEKLKKKKY